MDEKVYIVMRVITTQHDTSVSIPMGVFEGEDGAKSFMKEQSAEVHAVMALRVVGEDGQVIPNMTIGSFCQGLGIAKIGHKAQGPVEVSKESRILRPGASGGGIVLASR